MGIPTKHLQWVPCPSISSTINRKRYVERIQFENGGGDVRRSPAYQMEYELNFTGLAHEVDGIDAFNRFASGYYGSGLIYLAHPANFETNMFSAGWASPGLAEQGWPKISGNTPTFINTDSVAIDGYNQPSRTAVYNVTIPANAIPTKRFTIIIPPTYTLVFGASFTTTGTATVQARPVFVNGTYDIPFNLNALNPSDYSRMDSGLEGSSYSAVEFYITRTTNEDSTISITSMMAQLYKTGLVPAYLPQQHYTGEGSTGLMFADAAIVETYAYMHPPRKGISTVLAEVEAWR
jgi:hypothetical protein